LNDSYWYNSCGSREGKYQECGLSSCQSWGEDYCYQGDVYHQRKCYDRGCTSGLCNSDTRTDTQLVENCSSNEICQSGECIISSQDFQVQIEKTARNLSKNNLTWQETVLASPSDHIQFRIVVTSLGDDTLEDLIFIDTLPSQMNLVENSVRIDGIPTSQNIVSGAQLRDITSHQSRRIEFTAIVKSSSYFNYGLTALINTGRVSNTEVSDSDISTVKVMKAQVAGASTVSTGTGNKWLDYLVLPLLIALIGIVLLRKQFILIRKWIDKKQTQALDYRARQALTKLSHDRT
jgi:uncharacterized repeat protein (TIGR01451 family)